MFMLGDCFVEQEYNGMTGMRRTIDTKDHIGLDKLDYRRAPTNYLQFAFFFIFHLLYYHVLGPVASLLMIFTKDLRYFAYNMHLFRFSIHSLEGLISSLLTYLLIVCHIKNYVSENDDGAQELDDTYILCLFNKVMIYFLRSLIIANKYSTFGDSKIN